MRRFRQKFRDIRVGSPNPSPSTVLSEEAGISSQPAAVVAEPLETPQPQVPAELAATPSSQEVSLPSEQTVKLQARVWNDAYDELKRDEPSVVDAYERILSGQSSNDAAAIEVEGYPDNAMNTAKERHQLMKKLIEDGQTRTEKVATAKGKIKDVVEPFNQLRGVIALAVKSEPAASTAWAGITAVLDILASPLSEPGTNREGIKYILERAEWYWNLSALLLDPDKVDQSLGNLQKSLEKKIIGLYKKLLLYQIQSVCLYGRAEIAIIIRDLVKLDDWKTRITLIETAAESVLQSVAQFRDEDMSARLRNLDVCLNAVRTDLQSITAAVQDLGHEQTRRHEEDQDIAFLDILYGVDPRLEKAAIEDLKGGLVKEAHDLLLEQSGFDAVREQDDTNILWITGGPGRGKTMFLCGVIDKVIQQKQHHVVSYFFCRADRQSARTAKSVLRGLLWLICHQSWGIARRLRQRFGSQGKTLLDDDDAIVAVALEKMLASVMSAPSMRRTALVVDAIDECDGQSIPILLRVIGRLAKAFPAQWILSSRSFDNYKSLLLSTAPELATVNVRLSDDVVSSAVRAFIRHKVDRLSLAKGYDETLKDHVYKTLSSKAGDTFLWVALVCLELGGLGIETRHVRNILQAVPQGLNGLYERMLSGALQSADAPLCRDILPMVCISSRPLTLDELITLVPGLMDLSGTELREVIANCGSFLGIQGDDNSQAILTFVHESAREFLTETARQTSFPSGISQQHRVVLCQALTSINKGLSRNVYGLASGGVGVDDITCPRPDPLARLRYSCLHWLDHAGYLQQHDDWRESDDEVLALFILHDLLHWLEVLGLTQSLPQGTAGFQRLAKFYRKHPEPAFERTRILVDQSRRFILYNKTCIEAAPLQVYSSAILFNEQGGSDKIQCCYGHELDWVTLHPKATSISWTQLAQKFSSGYGPSSMGFSPDGELLVTGDCTYNAKENSHEHCVEIWDVMASHRVLYIQMNTWVDQVAFSWDGRAIYVVLDDGVIQKLESESGQYIGGFKHQESVREACFTPDRRLVALDSHQYHWDIVSLDSGNVVQSIEEAVSLCFSPDSKRVVAWLLNGRVSLWRIGNPTPSWSASIPAQKLCFFGDDKLAVRCLERTITIRSTVDGSEITSWRFHDRMGAMTWLRNGYSFMTWCADDTIKIYDETGKQHVQSLPTTMQSSPTREHEGGKFAYSASTHCVAWAGDSGIWYWDLHMPGPESVDDNTRKLGSSSVSELLFSPGDDGTTQLAAWEGSRLRLQRLRDGEAVEVHRDICDSRPEFAFSPNGDHLVASDVNGFFRVWDTHTGASTPKKRMLALQRPVSFSPDSRYAAFPLYNAEVQLWDLRQQKVTQQIGHSASRVAFSHDSQLLATADRGHIEVWNVSPPGRVHTVDVAWNPPEGFGISRFMLIAFSPDDQSLAIATNGSAYVWTLGDAEPRWHASWSCDEWKQRSSIAMSPDGSKVAVTADFQVWVWHVGHGETATTSPLYIEIPHKTRSCRFSADGKRLLVAGGFITLPLSADHGGGKLEAAQDQMSYRGLGLSNDCVWITRDGRNVLYLPKEYRPRGHPAESWVDEVAFTDSMVAMATDAGRIYILRFLDV